MFTKLQGNIPFCEALEQMPIYVKFMKDFLTRKRKLIYDDKVDLTKACIVIIQRKLLNFNIP